MSISRWAWLAIPCSVITYCATPCLTESCKAKEAATALEEFKDKEYERRNHIQQGEKYPQNYDYEKYAMIKIANRFLMWPSQHGSDRAIAFFWPSKTPTITMPQPKNEGHITVFFTDPYRYMPKDHYADIVAAKAEGRVLQWRTIKKGLDEVVVKDRGVYYLATEYKNNKNQPLTLFCQYPPPSVPVNINSLEAKSENMWNGIKVSFEFSSAYCQDWPEIYQYGMSIIINNVKEVQP